MLGIMEFVCWVVVVSLVAAFVLGLAAKWGWLEWLQIHAPNDFLSRLLNCKFCCSFWVGLIISLTLLAVTAHWSLLVVPFCSTIITRELW